MPVNSFESHQLAVCLLSSIVTLQTPCPVPDSSAGHCQSPAQELGGQSPQPLYPLPWACLVHQAGFMLYHNLGVIINCNPRREQVRLCSQGRHLFQVGTLEEPAQRLADSRHESVVQVNCRPVRCLRREAI